MKVTLRVEPECFHPPPVWSYIDNPSHAKQPVFVSCSSRRGPKAGTGRVRRIEAANPSNWLDTCGSMVSEGHPANLDGSEVFLWNSSNTAMRHAAASKGCFLSILQHKHLTGCSEKTKVLLTSRPKANQACPKITSHGNFGHSLMGTLLHCFKAHVDPPSRSRSLRSSAGRAWQQGHGKDTNCQCM